MDRGPALVICELAIRAEEDGFVVDQGRMGTLRGLETIQEGNTGPSGSSGGSAARDGHCTSDNSLLVVLSTLVTFGQNNLAAPVAAAAFRAAIRRFVCRRFFSLRASFAAAAISVSKLIEDEDDFRLAATEPSLDEEE